MLSPGITAIEESRGLRAALLPASCSVISPSKPASRRAENTLAIPTPPSPRASSLRDAPGTSGIARALMRRRVWRWRSFEMATAPHNCFLGRSLQEPWLGRHGWGFCYPACWCFSGMPTVWAEKLCATHGPLSAEALRFGGIPRSVAWFVLCHRCCGFFDCAPLATQWTSR
jgi:hypothetical protein